MSARKKKSPTPAAQKRKDLRDKVSSRKDALYNIWYVYGPKADRDWVLSSDVEYDHFISLESDPLVLNYDLDLEEVVLAVGSDNHRTTFDARVVLRGGTIQYREVKYASEVESEAATRTQQQIQAQAAWVDSVGGQYLVVTDEDLAPFMQRIENGRRTVAALSRVRDVNIDIEMVAIAAKLNALGSASIAEFAANCDSPTRAKVYGAIFRLLQQGRAQSDLDEFPLSGASVIATSGAQA